MLKVLLEPLNVCFNYWNVSATLTGCSKKGCCWWLFNKEIPPSMSPLGWVAQSIPLLSFGCRSGRRDQIIPVLSICLSACYIHYRISSLKSYLSCLSKLLWCLSFGIYLNNKSCPNLIFLELHHSLQNIQWKAPNDFGYLEKESSIFTEHLYQRNDERLSKTLSIV